MINTHFYKPKKIKHYYMMGNNEFLYNIYKFFDRTYHCYYSKGLLEVHFLKVVILY